MQPSMIEYYQDLARNVTNAKHGEKSVLVESAASMLGLSINTVYENLKKVGYTSGRKVRADKGDTHIDLDEARLICGMVYQTRRANQKSILSVENAIEIAFSNGQISAQYNPTTLLRVAEEHGFHPKQLARPTPHMAMQSEHPNHVWQVDASIGTLFYLKSGGVEFFDEKKHYKNKPQHMEAVKRHLCIRYAAVDHYSNAAYCKYYAASGENQEIFFDFIANAFLKRNRDGFHGVPSIIVMDKGAANTSKLVLNFLDRMGIDHYAHMTGNSRAKGSAEKMQDIIERGFESRLRLTETPINDAHHLNIMVADWMIAFNEQAKLNRNGINKTRMEIWNTIKAEELVIAPSMDVMQSILSSKPLTRKVNGELTISFESRKYSVEDVPLVKVGDTVTFSTNPYRYPNIDVLMTDFEGKTTSYECSPLEINDAGFRVDAPVIGVTIQAKEDTVTDIERKNIIKQSYGTDKLEIAEKFDSNKAQLYEGKLDPMKPIRDYHDSRENITAIPKRGTQLELDTPKQVFEKISIAEACKRIKADLGDQYPKDTYQYLSKHYTEIDPLEIDSIKRQLTTRSTLKVVGE